MTGNGIADLRSVTQNQKLTFLDLTDNPITKLGQSFPQTVQSLFPKLRFLNGNAVNIRPCISASGLEQYYGIKAAHLESKLRCNDRLHHICFNGRPGEQQKVLVEIPNAIRHQITDFRLYLVDKFGIISEMATNKS